MSQHVAAACAWCGEPASNCPNRDGECCCLPCFYRGPGHMAAPEVKP